MNYLTYCVFHSLFPYRQAFTIVENGYLESIGDLIAERTSLQMDICGLTSYQAYQKSPELV